MPDIASPLDSRAFHILAYGTFFGSTFMQSFVSGIVAYRTIPRVHFGQLQAAITPVFFSIQTVLAAALFLTYPGKKMVQAGSGSLRAASGWHGTHAGENTWTVAVPLLIVFVTSAANWLVLGPTTTKIMKERHHQETRDGKKSHEPGPHSEAMQKLNRRFTILHSASSTFDLVGFFAAGFYGYVLADRL